jgi:hypothetical protein
LESAWSELVRPHHSGRIGRGSVSSTVETPGSEINNERDHRKEYDENDRIQYCICTHVVGFILRSDLRHAHHGKSLSYGMVARL